MRSCHKARRSIKKSTRRTCGVCFAQSTRKDENYDKTNHSCFSTTIHPLKTPWVSDISCEKEVSSYCNNLHIQLIMLCVNFFFSLSSRGSFWRRQGHQEGCNDGTKGHPRRILPAVHRSAAEKYEKMYKTGKGLLQRVNHVIYCFGWK